MLFNKHLLYLKKFNLKQMIIKSLNEISSIETKKIVDKNSLAAGFDA